MSRMDPMPSLNIQTAPQAAPKPPTGAPGKVSARTVSVFYGEKQALFDVSLEMPEKSVTALIGPSGCGKSTFLRSINRMNDTIPNCRVTGEILIDGTDVNAKTVDPSSTTWPMACGCMALLARRWRCRRSSRPRFGKPVSGTR